MEPGKIYSPEETVRIADVIRKRVTDPEQCRWMLAAVMELEYASRSAQRKGMAKGLIVGTILGFILGLILGIRYLTLF
jgi:hypothetical protein